MVIGLRHAVPAAALLLGIAAIGARLNRPAPSDPCEATPDIHACAMFRQPEWIVRRVHAGRLPPAQPASEASPADGVTVTGAILVSEPAAILSAVAGAAEDASEDAAHEEPAGFRSVGHDPSTMPRTLENAPDF